MNAFEVLLKRMVCRLSGVQEYFFSFTSLLFSTTIIISSAICMDYLQAIIIQLSYDTANEECVSELLEGLWNENMVDHVNEYTMWDRVLGGKAVDGVCHMPSWVNSRFMHGKSPYLEWGNKAQSCYHIRCYFTDLASPV